jgi:hypothetical protein
MNLSDNSENSNDEVQYLIIDFYKEITQILCDSITLLKHREFIEQEITYMRNQIQREEKKDFTLSDNSENSNDEVQYLINWMKF